jgi:hypothetical protein
MMRTLKAGIAVAVVGMIACVVVSWPAALVRDGSSSAVRNYLLRQTPLGSDAHFVRRWLAARGAFLDETGLPNVGPPPRLILNDEWLNPDFFYEWETTLGSYEWPSHREVRAIYRFDRTDRLTTLRVVE